MRYFGVVSIDYTKILRVFCTGNGAMASLSSDGDTILKNMVKLTTQASDNWFYNRKQLHQNETVHD